MSSYFRKKFVFSVSLLGLIVLLTACGATGEEREAIVDNSGSIEFYYPLPDNEPGYRLKAPALKGVLGISPLDSDVLRGDRRMLFKLSSRPLELRLHHFRFWTDSPTKLVQQKISVYLSKVRYASKVIRFVPGTRVDYLLQGRLIKFERFVDTQSNNDEVLVSIELSITKESNGRLVVPATIYHIRQKSARASSANNTIVNAVKSFKLALGKAMLQFVQQNAAAQYAQRVLVNTKKPKSKKRNRRKAKKKGKKS